MNLKKKKKIDVIYVKVVTSNPVNNFYKKFGFTLLKTINRDIKVNILKKEIK